MTEAPADADSGPLHPDPDPDPDTGTGTGAVPGTVATPRRRWPVRVAIALLVVVVLLAAADLGAGWYFSNQVITVEHTTTYPVTVRAVGGGRVILSRTDDTVLPGTYGLAWKGGHAVVGEVLTSNDTQVVRTIGSLEGSLAAGDKVRIDDKVYVDNPRTGRGLDYDDVLVTGDLGNFPAWYVPGAGGQAGRNTWVIAVHGRGGSRTEVLRALPALHAAGLPVLAITYRNDVGAPAGPDGRYHLGDTEWQEVAAAVRYARGHGATDVVLYGWSMGGAVVMTALRRMPDAAELVRAVILDCPVTDWRSTLEVQADDRGLPGVLTATAEWLVERRVDLDLDDLDQRRFTGRLRTPVLLYLDLDDDYVGAQPTLDFAAARPDLVTLVTTTGGGHTRSWNVSPAKYDSTLAAFLTAHLPAPVPAR